MAAWNKLKDFFKNLWSDVSSGAFDFLKPVTDLWDKFTDNAQNTTNLIPAKNENTKAIKLPDLKHLKTDVVRNQSNNFNITINAVKNDDSESITDKVMNRVSDFSKTFLYDPVPEAAGYYRLIAAKNHQQQKFLNGWLSRAYRKIS